MPDYLGGHDALDQFDRDARTVHDDADYRAAVNAQHDDNDGPTTVAQLLDSYDHGYVNWDALIDGIDKRVFESFTRICDAIEDHRAHVARLSPAEREQFDARTR
jgi:hypothetical protein